MSASPTTPRRGPAEGILAALVAALSACAAPAGISVASSRDTDRVAVRPLPAGWKRIAVVPFGGDPAHRRPAEEVVALAIESSSGLAVVVPFTVERWYARSGVDGEAARGDAARWASACVDTPAEAPRDELRSLAARLAADALVVGRVQPGGAVADVVLVEGSSGEAVAALRRAGRRAAAELGVHELAMDATARAAADLVVVLRTPAGKASPVRGPEPVAPIEEKPWSPAP